MQQLAQRVMQYGWDFAGLWFEMWTRMGGTATGWPSPPSGAGSRAGAWPAPPVPPQEPPREAPFTRGYSSEKAADTTPLRLSVTVVSERRTAATLEYRSGAAGPLLVHALRAEGQEAPPIRDVTIESAGGDGITVRVVVASTQPPGVYNGLVIDAGTNVPRGTVSVRVFDETDR